MNGAPELEVLVEQDEDSGGGLWLLSPGVGWYRGAPQMGEILVPRSRAGRLTSLGRTADLTVPQGHTGRVTERPLRHRRSPVDYGQKLLRLVPVEAAWADEQPPRHTETAAKGVSEGGFAVTCPTHGMFYRRPRPDAPPYVEIGQVVEEGNILALVEVMKCFSAITYGGEGLPPRAEIFEIRAEDNSEVQADQILFVVKPA